MASRSVLTMAAWLGAAGTLVGGLGGCATQSEVQLGDLSSRSQLAINAEADRRIAALGEMEEGSMKMLAAERESVALADVTKVQMLLIMSEVDGSNERDRERFMAAIERYAGPRETWPAEE